jgi:hypothetical protein
MVRKVVKHEYHILDHDNEYKDCNIDLKKGKDKIKLGFYLKHLNKLEALLRLTTLQTQYLNTHTAPSKPYSPVAVMLTVNFRSPVKVQINKFISDLKFKMQYDLDLRGEDKEAILNYIGVREIHELPPKKNNNSFTKQVKPRPHHHFILTYCAKSFSYKTIKKLLTTSKTPDDTPSMRRYYALNSEGYLRLPKLSKKYDEVLDEEGNQVMRIVKDKNGKAYSIPKTKVSIAEYYFTRSMYSSIQHFSYICKVYTKEREDENKFLIPIPEINSTKMLDNLTQLKKWLTDRNVELPSKLYSKQPRINTKNLPLTEEEECIF